MPLLFLNVYHKPVMNVTLVHIILILHQGISAAFAGTSSCRPLSRDSKSFRHDAVHDGLGQVIADARDQGHGVLSGKITCPNKVGHGEGLLRGVDRKGRCGRSVETDESRDCDSSWPAPESAEKS